MSSSPPHNSNSGYNPYIPNNDYQITSSPSFNENLNLQLQNADYDNNYQYDEQLNNYTTNNNDNDSRLNPSISDNSINLDYKGKPMSQRSSVSHIEGQVQGQTQNQGQFSNMENVDSETVPNSTRNSSIHQINPNDDQLSLMNSSNNHYQYNSNFMSMTPQYNSMQESINDPSYNDFVPASIQSNSDNNLNFTVSSPHINPSMTNSTTSSSFNSLYYSHQALSNNSISSGFQQQQQQQQNDTPLQPSRRLSVSIMHNGLTTTPSTTPLRKQNNLTPRLAPNYGQVYSHRRSKSKLSTDKSPNTGNPFYNPLSFLSPKVQKKSHRKNISITNSISLTHLDTDLNLQNLHNLNYVGSPRETPLRTPGKGLINNSYYGDLDPDDMDSTIHNNLDIDNIDDRIDITLDQTLHEKADESDSYNDLFGSHLSSNLDNTFIVPNIIEKEKFNNRLVQTSNDLNRVLKADGSNDKNVSKNVSLNARANRNIEDKVEKVDNMNKTNRHTTDSILDSVASGYSNIDYIDELFPSDQSTVGSLQPNLLFNQNQSQINDRNAIHNQSQSNQQNLVNNDIFVDDTQSNFNHSRNSYQYKPSSSNSSPELLQSSLQYQLQYQFNEKSMTSLPSPNVVPPTRYMNTSSVPQTRQGSTIIDSKLQRSRSFFNLSEIAASKESKKYSTDYLESYDENSEIDSNLSSNVIPKSASLQEVAEKASSKARKHNESNSSNDNNINDETTHKTITRSRSKSKRSSLNLANIKHPEKLDLPQQSARSKSRTKKTNHDDKKIHECPLCHMRFQRPEHVKRHMLSHSSEKPFACPEEGCGKRFNRNDNLKQHLRNIHKKKI